MFLEKLQRENPKLIESICRLHREGKLLPDSFVVDLEVFRQNAAAMKAEADRRGITLWFMLKQLGRNPRLAQELVALGYPGAVAVDFKETQVMIDHGIPLSNVGHLVQVPQALVERVVAARPQVMTVYTAEKAEAISRAAAAQGIVQPLLLRVCHPRDMIYSGQTAGISLDQLPPLLRKVESYPGVEIAGVTSFPCFLYDETKGDIAPTPNLETVLEGADLLRAHGIEPRILNTPSATCVRTLGLMEELGGNCGEPGHGLTGTTPLHAVTGQPEKICVAYVSEVSHNYSGRSYCYGGGFYRRGHVSRALVGLADGRLQSARVIPPSLESIDYHFGLARTATVGDTVIMAFRYQVFVTRSDVVLVDGVQSGSPAIVGVWDSLGHQKA